MLFFKLRHTVVKIQHFTTFPEAQHILVLKIQISKCVRAIFIRSESADREADREYLSCLLHLSNKL